MFLVLTKYVKPMEEVDKFFTGAFLNFLISITRRKKSFFLEGEILAPAARFSSM